MSPRKIRLLLPGLLVVGGLLVGCSDRGESLVRRMRDDPMATLEFQGVTQVGKTTTDAGGEGALGSRPALRRTLSVENGDVLSGLRVIAAEAADRNWTIVQEPGDTPPRFQAILADPDDSSTSLSVVADLAKDGSYNGLLRFEMNVPL